MRSDRSRLRTRTDFEWMLEGTMAESIQVGGDIRTTFTGAIVVADGNAASGKVLSTPTSLTDAAGERPVFPVPVASRQRRSRCDRATDRLYPDCPRRDPRGDRDGDLISELSRLVCEVLPLMRGPHTRRH